MSPKRTLQVADRPAQVALQSEHGAGAPEDLNRRVWLSVEQAAHYLGISENALRCRMKRGTVPAWCYSRGLGRSVRFMRAALDELLGRDARESVLKVVNGHSSR